MSLARLWRDQGKRTEAFDLLAPIYGWFTAGFGTTDLKEAKILSTRCRREGTQITRVTSLDILPGSLSGGAATLTTTAIDRSSSRWLGISDLIAEPEGLPSSFVQIRTAVWTGATRDTRPISDISELQRYFLLSSCDVFKVSRLGGYNC